ncbi:MAG: DUF2156 domain-containing protein [Clostridia bacterium]|nr:DUF2156 domain-containing protein [Clostridia bacterium]
MAEFKEIQIEDKAWVDKILETQAELSLENNFTTAFIWRNIFGITISSLQGGKFYTTKTKDNSFMFPCGEGDIKSALEEIFDYCEENNIKPKFYSLTKKNKEILESFYPDKFSYKENRDGSDYVYEKEKLATLSGKKLSAKRNHINRFVEAYPDWEYEEINESNIDEVFLMNQKWCEMAGCEKEEGIKDESCAVKEAFAHFEELKLSGGLIRANGEVVAYSMGDKLSHDTFLVHIEKAFPDIQGAYPIINREFVIHNCEGFDFVNREDDAGDEGLRKAKLSYRPYEIIEKWIAESK